MPTKQQPPFFLSRIIPYLVLGIALVFMFIAFIFLSSILLIGAIVGLIIFAVTYVKARFFGGKKQQMTRYTSYKPPYQKPQEPQGKVYEHKHEKSDSESKKKNS